MGVCLWVVQHLCVGNVYVNTGMAQCRERVTQDGGGQPPSARLTVLTGEHCPRAAIEKVPVGTKSFSSLPHTGADGAGFGEWNGISTPATRHAAF